MKVWLQNSQLEFEFFFHTGQLAASWGRELASPCLLAVSLEAEFRPREEGARQALHPCKAGKLGLGTPLMESVESREQAQPC